MVDAACELNVLRAANMSMIVIAASAAAWPLAAALDFERPAQSETRVELLVVEVKGCVYCGLFRRDVVPAYHGSDRARAVPMRFVDLDALGGRIAGMSSPIDTVPTVLVMQDDKEIGRVAGYVGPETFFHAISRLLAQVR